MNARALIDRLQLKPHPEGGWFREIHRAAERVTTARGARSALTTIYYLLEREQLSRWHVVSTLPGHADHFNCELAHFRTLL